LNSKLEIAMSDDYVMTYRTGSRFLTVQPIDTLFRIVSISIEGNILSDFEIDQAISITNIKSSTSLQTPQKFSRKLFDDNEDSPSSVTSSLDSTGSKNCLYNEEFIQQLRDVIFQPSFQSFSLAATSHTPLLISIEGNIGAGKSNISDPQIFLTCDCMYRYLVEETKVCSP
jgi:hypothetical protein